MDKIIVVDNFISEEDIELVIKEIDDPSERLPYPEHYSKRNGGTALPYNKNVLALLKKYADLSNKKHQELNSIDDPIYTTKGYSSKWTKGNKGGPHIDDVDLEPFIEWSTVIYLNEPPEFAGGVIYFPEKNFEYTPKKGSAVFFPQGGKPEYVHGITEVTEGLRYTLLFHHSSNIEHADKDLL